MRQVRANFNNTDGFYVTRAYRKCIAGLGCLPGFGLLAIDHHVSRVSAQAGSHLASLGWNHVCGPVVHRSSAGARGSGTLYRKNGVGALIDAEHNSMEVVVFFSPKLTRC